MFKKSPFFGGFSAKKPSKDNVSHIDKFPDHKFISLELKSQRDKHMGYCRCVPILTMKDAIEASKELFDNRIEMKDIRKVMVDNMPIEFDGKYFVKDPDNKEPFEVGDYISVTQSNHSLIGKIVSLRDSQMFIEHLVNDKWHCSSLFIGNVVHLKEVSVPVKMPETMYIEQLILGREARSRTTPSAEATEYRRADLANKVKWRTDTINTDDLIIITYSDCSVETRTRLLGCDLKALAEHNFKSAEGWLPYPKYRKLHK